MTTQDVSDALHALYEQQRAAVQDFRAGIFDGGMEIWEEACLNIKKHVDAQAWIILQHEFADNLEHNGLTSAAGMVRRHLGLTLDLDLDAARALPAAVGSPFTPKVASAPRRVPYSSSDNEVGEEDDHGSDYDSDEASRLEWAREFALLGRAQTLTQDGRASRATTTKKASTPFKDPRQLPRRANTVGVPNQPETSRSIPGRGATGGPGSVWESATPAHQPEATNNLLAG